MDPLRRRRRWLSGRAMLMLGLEALVLALAVWRLADALLPGGEPPASRPQISLTEPTPARPLTVRDVLPTLTPNPALPARVIVFPGATMSAPIVLAARVAGSWETRHLGDSVGHLAGTSWLDDPGGNIVLAGHVETATGAPGPFKHLFEAQPGDPILLRDGAREAYFWVVTVAQTAPDDVEVVRQDGRRRLTLITCTDWDFDTAQYQGRLVVVAEPAPGVASP